ncbi:PaaI family thioesterase [Alicyclobacillus vulcanalis]|uniref:Acyl-coenzyme A thioesterase PaaI, contains HGG motif n=1 Tax=Alicyclobacillus vulcanalis TaxID=252246 RepID=A0A1N7N8P6_9BACL|nr:PaaI family thioesterase [Alicyclobacillus vulcanalis]SIS94702.1 Acyl-coenzyme A thioesterase PaaI, contains HGG motif [Alicyclobacillus vulcanalis]
MTPSPYVQDYYPDDFAWCYGCGRLNERGHHFRTRWDGDVTLTEAFPERHHTAVPGFVYGGYLAALVDCHSTGSGALALHRAQGGQLGDGSPVPRCVTASLHVEYRKPTPMGVPLRAIGRVAEVTSKKAVIDTQVWAGETLCVEARAVVVLIPDTMRG